MRRMIVLFIVIAAATANRLPAQDDDTAASVILTIAQQAEVPARDAGVLSEVLVREGQHVRAGELLARLDDQEAQLAHQRAVIELERVQKLASNNVKVRLAIKELEIAQAELKRATEASDRFSRSVTDAELDRLKLDVQRAALQLEQAEFELTTAGILVRVQENEVQSTLAKLRRRMIVAPIAGMVVVVPKRTGEWLEVGHMVTRLIATDRLRAEGFLDVSQLRSELTGKPVRVTVDLPHLADERFTGSIVFVSPEVDPISGQVRLWAEVDNSGGRLRPGMSGRLVME